MSQNSITDENDLIISKIVFLRKDEIVNQLEYKIYKKNDNSYTELDSSV